MEEQEIQRKEKELDSKIRKPAEAEKFKLETIAEAQKQKCILEAEAEAEAIALKGDAKAFAVEAKAKAEAEQMAKKADAWNEYGKAALMDMMLKVLIPPKCLIWVFQLFHFPPVFVLLKLTCLVTLSDRKLQVFKNSPKLIIFDELLST